jgi:hypothetical protein
LDVLIPSNARRWKIIVQPEFEEQRDPPDAEGAECYYREALTLADELGMRPLMAHCHLGLGTLYRSAGRLERARTELCAASALYRAMGTTFWLLQAEAELAKAGC